MVYYIKVLSLLIKNSQNTALVIQKFCQAMKFSIADLLWDPKRILWDGLQYYLKKLFFIRPLKTGRIMVW
jgi:hypothetical protein